MNNVNLYSKTEESTLMSSSSVTLEYSGKVTVSLCKKDKILQTKVYHNAGCSSLFKFIALCLQGDYARADKYRPCRVQLFNNTSEYPPITEDLDWDKMKPLTGFISSNRPATISENNGNYSTTIHFLVPAVYINKKILENNKINQICLYPGVVSDTTIEDNCSAYFLFVKEEEQTDGSTIIKWDALETTNENENINLLIDWELSIKNNGGN